MPWPQLQGEAVAVLCGAQLLDRTPGAVCLWLATSASHVCTTCSFSLKCGTV